MGLSWTVVGILSEDDDGLDAVTAPVRAQSMASTRAGDLIGTPGYMSPEQVDAEPGGLDARSDVFALGLILFEIATDGPGLLDQERFHTHSSSGNCSCHTGWTATDNQHIDSVFYGDLFFRFSIVVHSFSLYHS